MVNNQYKEKYPLLFSVERPSDIKHFSEKELTTLSSELRNYIIDVVSVRQGHLGSNLGVVELTVALHYVFDTPHEPLVWDVGHQAYAHKILCGRRDAFLHLRELGGISGFPRIEESPYDTFGTGHSSTSISAVVGMAFADAVQGVEKNHIAVIGDASIASGMALEALDYASGTDINVLIILNDNAMGIDPSTGALARHFMELRKGTATDNFFNTLGIPYHKVHNGHDIHELIDALKAMSKMSGVRILHVPTIKGKGYPAAEEEQTLYHYPGVFDRKTGHVNPMHSPRYQDIVGEKLLSLAQKDPKVYALTPAMPSSSGLAHMAYLLPQRVINTGIAESHTITMAAGMAVGGLKPFAVVYSTFLQRAYDQIIHDVAIQNLPVRFLI
ncbi:MAG: 1-deoxy-D-xylulose-5-phosphate synthase, partial [Flavobacteriales bacterium]|nr:1-deoxy-D-xylulose-5-phosphate synthase [Flavobacteriales bacterium]